MDTTAKGRPAGNEPAPDDGCGRQHHRTAHADPLPPGFVDLGGGELFGCGTADDMRAAADWLHRHYPAAPRRERPGPPGEPRIFNMSNYRVRQVLALGRMPERQRLLLVALATWMTDDTRVVVVAYQQLTKDTGQARNTVRAARRELEAAGKLASTRGGKYRGDRTTWTVLCLPQTAGPTVPVDNSGKGVSDVNPVSDADLHTELKGVKREPVRGSNEDSKGGQPQLADQRESGRGFNHQAKTPGFSLSSGADASGTGERETDLDEDDGEESDPDAKLLATAVPGADWLDVEWAITGLQQDKFNGKIRSVRAYLRKLIANGDARSLVDDAAAERRRNLADIARSGDPFGDPGRPVTVRGYVVDDTTSRRPPWCGRCREDTRQREDDEGRPYRCPACHPLAAPAMKP